MRVIKRLVSCIDEELSGAQAYAERYVEEKANGNSEWANKFRSMSEDEIRHAMTMHQYAAEKINSIDKVYKPSQEMVDKWEKTHKNYVEKVAVIRNMIAL